MDARSDRSNRGFSLVELIVVIAIMAVLVGILVPAYLKYVEKSRKNTDLQAIAQIMEAAEAVSTDEEYYVPRGAEFLISALAGNVTLSIPEDIWDDAVTGTEEDDYRSVAEKDWKDTANNGDPYVFKSKDWKTVNGSMVGTVADSGKLRWTVTGTTGVFQNMADYSSDFSSKIK